MNSFTALAQRLVQSTSKTSEIPTTSNGPLPMERLQALCKELESIFVAALNATAANNGVEDFNATDLFKRESGKMPVMSIEPWADWKKGADGKWFAEKHSNTILLKHNGYEVKRGDKSFRSEKMVWTLGFAKVDGEKVVLAEPWADDEIVKSRGVQQLVHNMMLQVAVGYKARPQQ